MNDIIHDRIKHIQSRLLDEVDITLGRISTAPASLTSPLPVRRRRLANMLGLWNVCARSACRRARCCRGEPLHCLRTALVLLPPETVAALRPRPRRGRKAAAKSC